MTEKELKYLEIKAYNLIGFYFEGKKDKGNNDYINHLYCVADSIRSEANKEVVDIHSPLSIFYERAYIVALLHDILEDTDCTEQELRNEGCDDNIIEAIKSVTRQEDEKYYFDFIKRVNKNPIGRLVKIYDLENNMDIRRLKKFGDYEQKRLKKYWYSWKYLKGEITEEAAEKAIHLCK